MDTNTQLKRRIQQESDSYSQDYYLDILDDPFSIYEFNVVLSALQDFATDYLEPGNRVLDMGCGTGVYTFALREQGYYEVFLADLSFKMLLQAQKKSLSNLVQADGEQMPFPDHFFDAIISTAMLEHVVDPGLILEEMLRITRPGGVLFLVTPNLDYYVRVAEKFMRIIKSWRQEEKIVANPERALYERLLSRDEIIRLLQHDGIEFLKYQSIYFIYAKRMLTRLPPKFFGAYLEVFRLLEMRLSKFSARGYLHVVIARKAKSEV